MTYTCIISSPLGNLRITLDQNKLSRIEFLGGRLTDSSDDILNNTALQKIRLELQHYFQNPTHIFSIPLKMEGTPFQLKVWEALLHIPAGNTLSYGELASQLKTSPRAIGNACRSNRIPVIIPCHRITAKNNLGGFSGQTTGQFLKIKKWLLQHETF